VSEPGLLWQEIDVVEQYAGYKPPSPTSVGSGSLHAYARNATGGCTHLPASGRNLDQIWSALGDYTSNWTVFTLDWTEDWIAMAVNGRTVATYAHNTTVRF